MTSFRASRPRSTRVSSTFTFAVLALVICALHSIALAAQQADARQIMELANASRADAGLGPLAWDAELAQAAYAHAQRMAQEGPIAHRYNGELDLPERAAAAGAHFSLIEENIAAGISPEQVHDGWMHSPAHHDNLLNAKIDHIGVALVPSHGVLYVVADYSQSVPSMTQAQVEAKVGASLTSRGITLVTDAAATEGARKYCAAKEGTPLAGMGVNARLFMHWQGSDLAKLPPELVQAIASGQYKKGTVGACEATNDGASSTPVFTAYRVAVLLY